MTDEVEFYAQVVSYLLELTCPRIECQQRVLVLSVRVKLDYIYFIEKFLIQLGQL